MAILNLTQHPASDDQQQDGVVEPDNKGEVKDLLTFDEAPSIKVLRDRAAKLAEVASNHDANAAMIGGMPAFMSALERALARKGVAPLYAFTQRESVEVKTEDGGTEKKSVFRHRGWTTPEVIFQGNRDAIMASPQKVDGEWVLKTSSIY